LIYTKLERETQLAKCLDTSNRPETPILATKKDGIDVL
jgi:hypothetical protein